MMQLQQQRWRCGGSRAGAAAVAATPPSAAAAAAAALHRARAAASSRSRVAVQVHAAADTVPVRFRIRKKLAFGQSLKVVGSTRELGKWKADKALELEWHEGDQWAGSADLPVGVEVEFKLVLLKDGSEAWEDGKNRRLNAWGPDYSLDVRCVWGDTRGTDIHAHELQPQAPPFRELAGLLAADSAAAEAAEGKQRREREEWLQKEREARASASSSRDEFSFSDSDDETAHVARWQGREVKFMRSNQHSHEREGRWDTSGLPPPPNPLHSLVAGDERAANWLTKLRVAKTVLVDEADRARPGVDALAAAFVYLQWVATGAIACAEGGGHFRPNHHARTAQDIFRSLEWAIEEDAARAAAGQDPRRAATLLARRMSTRLPSFGEAFTQTVPLTRIRDIAHRNDIPSDLKQEIKHTLQNKLHRNAGPEDLVAAEAMLVRVTAHHGQYNDAFVNEFRIFVAELREFFNAATLTQLMDGAKGAMGDEDRQVIDFFLAQKAALDGKPSPSPEDLVATLHALTTARALLLGGLSSGLRNDAPDAALAMRQRWRLAEVRAEDYAFVLLSRLVNAVEALGGGGALLHAHDLAWAPCLGGLVLGLRQLGLGGWAPGEAMAIEAELTAWQAAGGFSDRDNALRLKATLERLQRLTETFSELLLELLPPVARLLGDALGVAPHAVATFTEAEIRAHVVFQVSKLTTLLLRTCRAAAGASAWDPLVGGTAVGRLVEMQELDPAALARFGAEPVVVLLRSASGDEEVSSTGAALQGVILTQDLPHLSHLGVRARQERVPFAMLDDAGIVEQDVAPLLGQTVALTITPDSVRLVRATEAEAAAAVAAAATASRAAADLVAAAAAAGPAAAVSRVAAPRLLPLLDCTPSLAGAKASACARLEQVSLEARQQKAALPQEAFVTPRGACVPFGIMDLALAAQPQAAQQRFAALLDASEAAPLHELDAIAAELQQLVGALPLPGDLAAQLAGAFPAGATLICRSSANVEDLAGMSGAGLYDSVPNVPADRPADVAAAVAAVWASLYTRRAILSRRAAGVRQRDTAMAVLVQELLVPTFSFVLHTASPMGDDPSTAEIEVAAGLGETLASGARGSAWRLAVNKATGAVRTLAFANFSEALLPANGGGGGSGAAAVPAEAARELAGVGVGGGGGLYARPEPPAAAAAAASTDGSGRIYACASRTMDYSRLPLSQSGEARLALGRRLGAVASLLERTFGGPQDVEGALVGDEVFVVQTRPQP